MSLYLALINRLEVRSVLNLFYTSMKGHDQVAGGGGWNKRKAPPERGKFFRLEVYNRGKIPQVGV